MDSLWSLVPSRDQGLLPLYLFIVGVVSIGNSVQNLVTLHYTRRIYNGIFVPNHSVRSSNAGSHAEDRVDKLVPASSTGKDTEKAQDQVTPLAARVFGVWTMLAGIVRIYTAHDVGNRSLYQLSIITHALAAVHFTSELLVFKTLRLTGPQFFPLAAGFGGTIWMVQQYGHYVSS